MISNSINSSDYKYSLMDTVFQCTLYIHSSVKRGQSTVYLPHSPINTIQYLLTYSRTWISITIGHGAPGHRCTNVFIETWNVRVYYYFFNLILLLLLFWETIEKRQRNCHHSKNIHRLKSFISHFISLWFTLPIMIIIIIIMMAQMQL